MEKKTLKGVKFYTALTLFMALLDQMTKALVKKYFDASTFIEIIPDFIHLTHQQNKGVSFSFLGDLPDVWRVPLLVGVSALVILGIILYLYKNWDQVNQLEKWGFALILGGALGNLWDRAVYQSVTDFMYFHFKETGFFVNNLADDQISIGFVLLLWGSLMNKQKEAQ